MKRKPLKPGEQALADDPAEFADDAHFVFVGRVRSPWTEDGLHPKNPTEARMTGGAFRIEIDAPYRPALSGLGAFSHVWVLAWLHKAERTPLVIQPPHAASPRGVFALRSPVRPNPIGLSAARLLRVEYEAGLIVLDAIDFLDGTPVIDVKPYRPGIDAMPEAIVG